MILPVGGRGRVIAVTLLILPLVVLMNFAVRPLIGDYLTMIDEIAQAEQQIKRLSHLIAERPTLEASAVNLQRAQATATFLLAGDSATLAAAGLQSRLQSIADQFDIRMVRVLVEDSKADGPLERVALQAHLQADSRGLRDLLYALETGEPYVFIETLNISAGSQRQAAQTGLLEVRLTLSGLRVTAAGSNGGGTRG